jgi:hypothetical protein
MLVGERVKGAFQDDIYADEMGVWMIGKRRKKSRILRSITISLSLAIRDSL